ncbi:hypothetical protein ATO6_01365 [Oceanicola sp. 22II-s10i]|uniref:GNAT family N-acetyltransferase n=1 Tax=Oceanicola sp. 22II-s10i TaxID=1317116 RepID=UPI000B52381E|nr:GNAT family N-acetyltransferase [Oceanicola sp. 22II-s10i]OWU85608.1 hypothetical protein ATO6_01365 [Oceanicola sp. 22II-s10i]
MTLTVPVIETERLILREPREEDFEALVEYSASDRLEFIGGPKSRYGAWENLLAQMGHWVLRGYGFWTIEDRESGEPVGRTGIIRHDGWREPELGWGLFNGMEGKGFATEAASAARLHAATEWGFTRLISQIHPDNGRSISVALRLGAVLEAEDKLLGEPCLIYRHPDPRENANAA